MSNRPTKERLQDAMDTLKLSVNANDVPHVWALIYEIEAQQAEIERLSTAIEDALSVAEMLREDITLEPWATLREAITNDTP